MNELLSRATPGPTTARDRTGRRRATAALARVEAVRMLRHPVTVIGVLLLLGPWVYGWLTDGVPRTPVLQDEDRGMQILVLLVLGGSALIVANLAALRAHRHHTTDQYGVLALPDPWRTGAFLLAVLPLGLLAGAVVAVRITVLSLAPAPAGRPNPYELVTGPVGVLLLGAAGVLLARLARTAVVAPLVLLGIVAGQFVDVLLARETALSGLLPVRLGFEAAPLPAYLMGRPAAMHLVYLAGLVVLCGSAALWRGGARGRRLAPLVVSGLALTLVAGGLQLRPADAALVAARKTATVRPADAQTCRTAGSVTYCAFADFAGWIGEWDPVVRGVLRAVPDTEARRPLAVRQRVFAYGGPTGGGWTTGPEEMAARAAQWRAADRAAGTPNAVTVGSTWGDGRSEVGLAGLVAYEVIARQGAGPYGVVCGSRAVLVAWLAGQATPATAAGLRTVDDQSTGGVGFTEPNFSSGVDVPDREMAVAWALLRQPADRIAAVVRTHWGELIRADTPTERIGALFGVPVPAQLPEGERSTCSA